MASTHTWKFFRAGGFDQVKLESGADLMALDQLDQKLWVALACPTSGLEFDNRTLSLIDTDRDGRIRAPEVIAAVKWAGSCLKNPTDLLKGGAELPLSAISDSTEDGRQILASAKQILSNLGTKEALAITLEDVTDTAKIFAQTQFNGDGIVPADSTADEATKSVINDIIACQGAEMDRSGKPGVNQAKLVQFFADAQAYSDWWKKAETDPSVLPLNSSTASAAEAFRAVRVKVDDYFTRCRLAAFDARAVAALNREEKEYLSLTVKELTVTAPEIAGLPLAQVGPKKPLPLSDGLNPAWAGPMARFRTEVVGPLLESRESLTDADWSKLCAQLSPYESWMAGKPASTAEKLGLARVREILGGKAKEEIAALIAKDNALEPEANAIVAVERLVLYHRDLFKLLNNFVAFRDFYQRTDKAIFQSGTLYLDQRSCDLCVRVEDAAKHSLMATLAGTYLAYCDCTRKGTGEKMQIIAAFTDGDSDNLMVGRNGVFYDRKGRDWDASIVKILDNPISIRQAFWSPYKKAARMIQEQIAKRAANADQAAATRLAQAATKLEKAGTERPAAPPEPKKIDTGTIAALGVGAAGIGGMIGGVVTGFLNLKAFMPLGVLAIILAISGPSMLLAWLKLRKRNLGPILDANGWAINARAKVNVPFGASLTRVAVLPPGSHRDLADPFAEKRRPWGLYWFLAILLLLVLGWLFGQFDRILPDSAKSPFAARSSESTNAPPAQPVPVQPPK